MMSKKILVVGDVILDRYIQGDTLRMSPEAPVPIVKVNQENLVLGGAANVAHNLVNLKIETFLLGSIGNDRFGNEVSSLLEQKGIKDLLIYCSEETTTKTRVLSRNQQMLRIDRETIQRLPSVLPKEIKEILESTSFDLIVVSDYAKGFISGFIMDLIKGLNVPIFVDPKTNDWQKYKNCYLVKPNLFEIEDYLGKKLGSLLERSKESKQIVVDLNLKYLVLTLGSQGMVLSSKTSSHDFPASPVEVFDVTGAGDTAISVLAYEYCMGTAIKTAIKIAIYASSFVVTKPKTYAISFDEFTKIKNLNL